MVPEFGIGRLCLPNSGLKQFDSWQPIEWGVNPKHNKYDPYFPWDKQKSPYIWGSEK